MREGIELCLGQEVVVEYRLGKGWVREARLYAEEGAEPVQQMGEAPLVDGSLVFGTLGGCGTGEIGCGWCRWGTA